MDKNRISRFHGNDVNLTSYLRVIVFVSLSFIALGSSVPRHQPESVLNVYPGDFLEYWASARLLLSGGNPYSAEQQLALQHSIVGDAHQPLMMWNPPWTLMFILPFGLVSFSLGHFLWSMLILATLLFCSAQLWRLYGGPANRYWVAWLACLSIAPTYLTLYLTQIDPLVLLGIVGFLYFQSRQQWWYAGSSLTLVAIKPHLVLIFGVALNACVLKNKKWRVVLGAAAGAIIAVIIPLLLEPRIFSHYFSAYSTNTALRPFDWATHTVSTAVDIFFHRELPWIRFVPSLCALVWFVFYWRQHRDKWNWIEQMPLLLLVSQATTIFAWVWDQIVLLPALISIAVWTVRGGPSRIVAATSVGMLIINLPPLLVLRGVWTSSWFWLFWMVPVFLIAYVVLRVRSPEYTITA
jgi:hypothetical protein